MELNEIVRCSIQIILGKISEQVAGLEPMRVLMKSN